VTEVLVDAEQQKQADVLREAITHPDEVYLKRISQDMSIIRQMLSEVIAYMRDAEKEVSEKMRRFMMYMHDIHDITYMYEERGLNVPQYILREMERCDDRLRQLLGEEHLPGGTFEKVRRKMAEDIDNKWDHTRQLSFKGRSEAQ
jgi:hypothetical protein